MKNDTFFTIEVRESGFWKEVYAPDMFIRSKTLAKAQKKLTKIIRRGYMDAGCGSPEQRTDTIGRKFRIAKITKTYFLRR